MLAGLILCLGIPVFGTEIVAHPEIIDAHLRNPGMGFIYPAVQQPIPETADVFYIWINTWTDLEAEPGQFNWKLPNIVNVIEAAARLTQEGRPQDGLSVRNHRSALVLAGEPGRDADCFYAVEEHRNRPLAIPTLPSLLPP